MTPPGIAVRPPQGSGPGVLLLHDGDAAPLAALAAVLAEEGYSVLLPEGGAKDLAQSIAALRAMPSFKGRVGAVGFGRGGAAALEAAARGEVDCAVSYYEDLGFDGTAPVVVHLAEQKEKKVSKESEGEEKKQIYSYGLAARGFATPGDPAYDKPNADIAYTRTLALLRRVLGPHFDLGALWEAHRYCEFNLRDADATMDTMVELPYVNHIPTLTGGYGKETLRRFYRDYFIPNMPADIRTIPVSRTVGTDRVVNEWVMCFTHDCVVDWLLPGVAPTGRYIEVPLVGIITFRGDKLVNEHIYWDQASVLVQAGLLDPKGLPVAGIEAPRKLLDPSLPSNHLIPDWEQDPKRGA